MRSSRQNMISNTQSRGLLHRDEYLYSNVDDNFLDKMGRYYPQIDVCQSEKDGDIAAKKKELELAAEEDFGNSRVC